jgi:hypothetical protein
MWPGCLGRWDVDGTEQISGIAVHADVEWTDAGDRPGLALMSMTEASWGLIRTPSQWHQ